MIQAISDDLAPIDIERAARRAGWTTEKRPCQMVLTRCFGIESIKACLVPPRIGGWEVDPGVPPGAVFQRHVTGGGLGVSMGTGTAYQYELARIFSDALCRRYPELTVRSGEIDRVIHEMVANALVHGNLEVASPHPGLAGFDAYCRSLDAALADPALLVRPVEVSALRRGEEIEICVRDHGRGFDPELVSHPCDALSPRQHGFAIISAFGRLEFFEGGRCAVLRHVIGGA